MSSVLFDKILGRVREDANGGGGGGSTPKIVTVSQDLSNITNEQLDSLVAGDMVVVETSTIKYPCFVTSRAKTTIYLYYVPGDNYPMIRVKFQKSGGIWSPHATNIPVLTPAYTIQPGVGMSPNALYNLGELSSSTTFIMSNLGIDPNLANVWMWTFSTGATAPTITWPNQITMWADGAAPTIEANKYYEINVMNGLACVVSADVPQNN